MKRGLLTAQDSANTNTDCKADHACCRALRISETNSERIVADKRSTVFGSSVFSFGVILFLSSLTSTMSDSGVCWPFTSLDFAKCSNSSSNQSAASNFSAGEKDDQWEPDFILASQIYRVWALLAVCSLVLLMGFTGGLLLRAYRENCRGCMVGNLFCAISINFCTCVCLPMYRFTWPDFWSDDHCLTRGMSISVGNVFVMFSFLAILIFPFCLLPISGTPTAVLRRRASRSSLKEYDQL